MVAVLQAQVENYEKQLGPLPELAIEPEPGESE